ncbi:MAG: phage recombination protein Bet [Chloroflexi bacterium]|jgi:phage recombination protein Bet|nr:phage recombination protein Bet [Chloroflexota bacterium]
MAQSNRRYTPEDVSDQEGPASQGGAATQGGPATVLQKLDSEKQESVLMKYIPEDQPSPRAWVELIRTHVLGVDSRGNPRPFDDLLLFLSACKRTQLDPLSRQIYAVYRWDSRLRRERMTIQISIDGMRLIAQRSGLYGGQDDALFIPEDESEEYPTKATVTVYRLNPITGERMPVTASARWSEYAPRDRDGKLMGLWSRMPYLMLAKVAEALALRKAFPQELSGLYTTEEMTQADPAGGLNLPEPDPQAECMPTTEENAEYVVSRREQLRDEA